MAKGVAGNVSPVLAGFSLAAIATVVTTKSAERPPLGDEAVVALTASAVLLLAAMQLGFQSLRYAVSPAQRLEWNPEARARRENLQAVRQAHNEDVVMAVAYAERFRLVYNSALVAFIGGLSLLTYPETWSDPKLVAFVFSVTTGVVQILWMLRVRGFRRPSVGGVLPRRSRVRQQIAVPSELEDWQLAAVLDAANSGESPRAGFVATADEMWEREANGISLELRLRRRARQAPQG